MTPAKHEHNHSKGPSCPTEVGHGGETHQLAGDVTPSLTNVARRDRPGRPEHAARKRGPALLEEDLRQTPSRQEVVHANVVSAG